MNYEAEQRINRALAIAMQLGGVDGDHHKAWVIDQMVRELTGCQPVQETARDARGHTYEYSALSPSEAYLRFVAEHNAGEDGPATYSWHEGTPP